jgi:hypothetical protein
VIYIENGPNYHTYTFHITKANAPANAPVENLVLTPLPDGTYKELLVTYNLTPAEKLQAENGIAINTHGKAQITELAKGTYNNGNLQGKTITGVTCGWTEEVQFTVCDGGDHHSNGEATDEMGGPCHADNPSLPYLVAVYKCDWIYGTDPFSSSGPGATVDQPIGAPGAGAPISGTCPDNGLLIAPIDPTSSTNMECESGVPTQIIVPMRPVMIKLDVALDPKTKCMLQKMSGDTNLTDNVITLPTNSTTDDLFQKMLRKFNGVDAPQLAFKYDPTLTATSGAYAKGTSLDGGITYQVIVGEGLLQSSNIRIRTALIHEITHAFMLHELFQLHMIYWDINGDPKVAGGAYNVCMNNSYFSNDEAHRFAELLCLLLENPQPQLSQSDQWMHDLFGMQQFVPATYAQKIADYINNNHDWGSESVNWNSAMQNKYGNNWKSIISMNMSMDAIRQTYYFSTWSNQTPPDQFHTDIVSVIDNGQSSNSNNNFPANNNCN